MVNMLSSKGIVSITNDAPNSKYKYNSKAAGSRLMKWLEIEAALSMNQADLPRVDETAGGAAEAAGAAGGGAESGQGGNGEATPQSGGGHEEAGGLRGRMRVLYLLAYTSGGEYVYKYIYIYLYINIYIYISVGTNAYSDTHTSAGGM